MPSTHSSLHYHMVFSTKNRQCWIDDAWRSDLHRYLGGCIRKARGVAEEVGGVADHVHLLLGLDPIHRLSDIVREIKHASSKWVHEKGRPLFAWQEGYGVFTVSPSNLEQVRQYIRDQEAHHERATFQDEYRALLERNGVAFDERYL